MKKARKAKKVCHSFEAVVASIVFFASPLCASPLSGDEPDRLTLIEGFSVVVEPIPVPQGLRRFQGELRWRWRADKPNAETFGAKTSSEFINPLYLYWRAWLSYELSEGETLSANGVFLRRDETSSGASEPPVTRENVYLFFRHATLAWRTHEREFYVGDYLVGWAQGLVAASYPGSPYRPFFLEKHQAKISANTSSYENTGLRGAAYVDRSGPVRVLAAWAQTPMNARVEANGTVDEDLMLLTQTDFGELGRSVDLERRHSVQERTALVRAEFSLGPVEAGVAGVYTRMSRYFFWQPVSGAYALPSREGYIFSGRHLALWSVDALWRLGDEGQIAGEAALSLWRSRPAPGALIGWRRAKRRRRTSAGIFYLSPYYASRLADALRLESDPSRNRAGVFLAHQAPWSRHELGGHAYIEKNLASDFSSSAASRGSPDPRLRGALRLDDRMGLGRRHYLYARADAKSEPYLISAADGALDRLDEIRSRLEWQWEGESASFAVGTDHSWLLAREAAGERSESRDFYLRGRARGAGGLKLDGKLAYFDMGPALFGTRQAYLSSSEFYWPGLTMSSMANQSLFASYAPRGWRWAVALGDSLGGNLDFWAKLGSTAFLDESLGSSALNTEERDDSMSLSRWDFKTEITWRW